MLHIRFHALTSLSLAALLLTACGQSGTPTAALQQNLTSVKPAAAGLVASNTSRMADPSVKVAPSVSITPATPIADPKVDPDARFDVGPDDPPDLIARMEGEVYAPSAYIDDVTPYNVVVTERTAHTTTIAWHTEVPTRGIIEYGRSWGFEDYGYTKELVDDVAKTDHKLTITELRRWTGYKFRVTSVTALGLKFQEQDRSFRTKFWSWR
jgi:hypothetical protein